MNRNAIVGAACCLLLAAPAITPPQAAASPIEACPDAPNTLTAPSFTVPAGTTTTFPTTTTIRAAVVNIQGTLTTAEASEGQAAPGLCIEAEALTLGSTAVLCTGGGHAGTAATTTSAAGGAATDGGALSLFVRDRPATLGGPTFRALPGSIICTGRGGDGGPGEIVDCVRHGTTANVFGGAGGDGGLLTVDFLGAASGLSLPAGALHVGNGGDGGDAWSLTGDDGSAMGGAGGDSRASLTGLSPALLLAALSAGSGGDGGDAVAGECGSLVPCTSEMVDPFFLNCLAAQADSPCNALPINPVCQTVQGCAHDTRPFLACLTTGPKGYDDVREGQDGVRPGGRGTDGTDARADTDPGMEISGEGVKFDPVCKVTQATAGGPGGKGDPGTGQAAQGGPGGEGPLYGGNGGQAWSYAGSGMPGGPGGRGGNGFDTGFMCAAAPCMNGGLGGPGGDSGKGSATGGAGGKGTYGYGGNGGNAVGKVGVAGKGGEGGPGGIYSAPFQADKQCAGGCGGQGGTINDMDTTPGAPGPGLVRSGFAGQETGEVKGAGRTTQGAPGPVPPGDC